MQRLVILVVVLYVIWRVLYVRGLRVARARAAREEEYLSRLWAHGREWRGAGTAPAPADDEPVACDVCGTSLPSRQLVTGADGRRRCETCSGGETGQRTEHGAAG